MTMANMDREQLGELLSCYVDNELEDRERAFVERLIDSDADVRRWYESLRKTIASVHALPQHEAPVSLAADLLEQLERRELLDADVGGPRSTTVRFPWFAALSAAAALVAVTLVGISQYPQWSSPNATPEKLALNVSPDSSGKMLGTERGDIAAATERDAADALRRDAMDLTAKLRSGANVEAIRTHDFSNESVRLTVALQDQRSQTTAVERIVSHLASARVVDIASPDVARTNLAASAFFVNGKVDVNFKDRNQREVLVRIPAASLDGLLDAVAVEAVNAERVTFAAGSLSYDGLDNARRTLRPLTVEAEHKSVPMRRTRIASRGRRPEQPTDILKPRKIDAQDEGLAVELFRTLDIAEDVVAAAGKPDGQSATEVAELGNAVALDVAKAEREVVGGDRVASADTDDVRTNEPMTIAADAKAPQGRGPTVTAAPLADEDGATKAGTQPVYFVTLVLEFVVPPPEKPAAAPDAHKPPTKNNKNGPAKTQ